jgi:uncharacterized cupin superfamily protein
MNVSIDYWVKSGGDRPNFKAQPINASWILEGNPVARLEHLSSSADGTASTYYWDCTAGRFNWFYAFDETLYVLEGSVVLKGASGIPRRIIAGDTIYFPAGAQAEWTVETYIRKLAFCRTPEPKLVTAAKRAVRRARGVLTGSRSEPTQGMF